MSGGERQGAFDLSRQPGYRRADFLVSACNAAALAAVERWPEWRAPALLLHGPPGCGKTHLAHLWCARSGGALLAGAALAAAPAPAAAIAVDDADAAPERALLHLYNACLEAGGSVLLLARCPPAAWPVGLADLASRLRALPAIAIAAPDDAVLGAVLVKHFADRQLRVAPKVIAYLGRRMERSFAAAAALAARLDRMALARGGAVTIPLARRALADAAAQSPSDLAVT
jgi:chromosomal replication initiation ATPase DnaA